MSSEHLGPMVAYLEALLILWRDYSSGRVFYGSVGLISAGAIAQTLPDFCVIFAPPSGATMNQKSSVNNSCHFVYRMLTADIGMAGGSKAAIL